MIQDRPINRRALMVTGVAASVTLAGAGRYLMEPATQPTVPARRPMRIAAPQPAVPRRASVPAQVKEEPQIVREALAALNRHGRMVRRRDRIAIVDFSIPSSQPRMQILDIASGKSRSLLVAHGSGSDPGHTGFLHKFSNQPDSNASSQGAFVTADYYVGKHGRSQRLIGLDPTNNNALERAIVVHGAWYANADMIPAHGKLGRSQGCFAVGETELAGLFDQLGQGRMIYAAKA